MICSQIQRHYVRSLKKAIKALDRPLFMLIVVSI